MIVFEGVPVPDGYRPRRGDRLRMPHWDGRWFEANGTITAIVDDDFDAKMHGRDQDGDPDWWYLPDPEWRLIGGPSFESRLIGLSFDELTAVPEGCTMRPVPDALHQLLTEGVDLRVTNPEGAYEFDAWSLVEYQRANPEPESYTPRPGDRVELADGWFDVWWIEPDELTSRLGGVGQGLGRGVCEIPNGSATYLGDAVNAPPWFDHPALVWQQETEAP